MKLFRANVRRLSFYRDSGQICVDRNRKVELRRTSATNIGLSFSNQQPSKQAVESWTSHRIASTFNVSLRCVYRCFQWWCEHSTGAQRRFIKKHFPFLPPWHQQSKQIERSSLCRLSFSDSELFLLLPMPQEWFAPERGQSAFGTRR